MLLLDLATGLGGVVFQYTPPPPTPTGPSLLDQTIALTTILLLFASGSVFLSTALRLAFKGGGWRVVLLSFKFQISVALFLFLIIELFRILAQTYSVRLIGAVEAQWLHFAGMAAFAAWVTWRWLRTA